LFLCITKNKKCTSSLKTMGVAVENQDKGFKQEPTFIPSKEGI
jgi:hypothetical protein